MRSASESKARKLDLHVHSRRSSDGVLPPREVVSVGRQKGLAGIAITDHNTIAGGAEAKRYESPDFEVIVGAEIMTEKGEVIGLFLTQEIRSRRLVEVIDEIRGQGGLVIVPHPFDRLRSSAFAITAAEVGLVDAVEVYNARCLFQRHNRNAVAFAHAHDLPMVGGSDAHYANEIGLGGIMTSCDDLREAILNRDLTVFGKRSSPLNHVRTKLRKSWRKVAR